MTPDQIAELEALEKAAREKTEAQKVASAAFFGNRTMSERVYDETNAARAAAYASFIAAAANALPDLIADWKRMREALEEIDRQLTCYPHRDLDGSHYCPNCDTSIDRPRDIARAALADTKGK